MAGDVSVVCLSKQPFHHEGYSGPYVNLVCDHDKNLHALHLQRMLSIFMVQTPYFTWVDVDDPIPDGIRPPVLKGLLYGRETITYLDWPKRALTPNYKVIEPKLFYFEGLMRDPKLIHKAMVNTALARKVVEQLPNGDYYTEMLFYGILGLWRGVEVDPVFNAHWHYGLKPGQNEMSRAIPPGWLDKSRDWFRLNAVNAVKRLTEQSH